MFIFTEFLILWHILSIDLPEFRSLSSDAVLRTHPRYICGVWCVCVWCVCGVCVVCVWCVVWCVMCVVCVCVCVVCGVVRCVCGVWCDALCDACDASEIQRGIASR